MGATFLGGMGIAFQGARQGEQDNIDRANQAENREFLRDQQEFIRGQRKFQEGQQARTVEEQGRADKLRTQLESIPRTSQVDLNIVKKDDEGNDMPAAGVEKPRTQDAILRDVAKAYQDAGDIGKYFELSTAADGIAYKRAGGEFNRLLATANATPLPELARKVGAIFDADPTGGGVQSIEDIPGGVRVTLVNRDTGQTQAMQFVGDAGKKQLIDMAQAHYSPQTIAEQLKYARQIQLEMVKKSGTTSVPDGYVERSPAGDSRFVRTQAGSAGGKDGKPPKTRDELGAEQLELALTKMETKGQTPQQAATARRTMSQLLRENPEMPPEVGVDLAIKVATDPEAVKPEIKLETGAFDDVVRDEKSGGVFSVKKNVGDANKLPAGMSEADAKAKVREALAKLDAAVPGLAAAYTAAAFDKANGRATLDAFMSDLARKSLERDPRFAQMSPDQQRAAVTAAVAQKAEVTQNYLNLVTKFGEAPKAAPASKAAPSRRGGFGLVPDAPAAPAGSEQEKWSDRQQKARGEQAAQVERRAAETNALSAQFQADKASMPPEDFIRKYDALRGRLSQADARELFNIERQPL